MKSIKMIYSPIVTHPYTICVHAKCFLYVHTWFKFLHKVHTNEQQNHVRQLCTWLSSSICTESPNSVAQPTRFTRWIKVP